MVEPILDMMGAVLTRWTVGAAAATAAPVWSVEVGAEPAEAELRLLALAGQFLDVAVIADAPEGLHTLPDIPPLALPSVPEGLRSLLRRILGAIKDGRTRGELLHFLAERGCTTHPGDWMPAASDEEAPDVYAPWRDWADIAASANAGSHPTGGALTADTWDDFWPAMRKVALTELRQCDPEAARALMEAKFATTGAEERLRLLGLLANGLSTADRDFLQSLAATDRAAKVKALATSLLGRLGYGPAVGENATELAGFFEIGTKGLLRRTKVIGPRAIKTPAQGNRRRQLFVEVEAATFATTFGVAPEDLIGMWSWGEDHQADFDLAGMIARSAADQLLTALVVRLQHEVLPNTQIPVVLRSRLTVAQRTDFARRALANSESFANVLGITGGTGRIDDAIGTKAGTALIGALGAEGGTPAQQAAELLALGLIASRAAAAQALDRLNRAGLLGAEPRLDMLRLNAALDDEGLRWTTRE